jgi:phage gp29-like protein
MNFSMKPLFARLGRALVRSTAPKADSISNFIVPAMQARWLNAGVSYYTPQRVQQMWQSAAAGDLVSEWEMFDLMETTWPELSQCLNELKDSVVATEFEVVPFKLRNSEPTAEAVRRAQLVEELLWTMTPTVTANENDMEDTLRDLLDARAKGLSVLEIDWAERMTSAGPALGPRATRWVHPSWYGYDRDYAELLLRIAPQTYGLATWPEPATGTLAPFPPDKFIIGICKNKTGHPLGAATLHVLGFWWSAFNFTSDAFFDLAQIFGQPIRWANYDPGMGGTDKAKLQAMLEGMGRSAWGMFPEGVTFELKEAMKSATDNPQKVLLDTANKICRLLILRQTLTSDVGDSGSRALGDVHQQTKAGVELACAKWACKSMQQLVRSICVLNFGDDSECPWLKPKDAQEEPKSIAEVLAIVKRAGLEPADDELPEIGERLGFDVQRVAPAVAAAGGLGQNDGGKIMGKEPNDEESDPKDEKEGEQTLKAAQAKVATQLGVPAGWLNPLTDYLENIEAKCRDESLSDADLQEFLLKATQRVPELFGRMDISELAGVFESAMGGAALQAVRKGLRRGSAQATR